MLTVFNLREWLTIEESAKYLSLLFKEDVTKGDVLRFALEGKLNISVHLVNGIDAKRGRVAGLNEIEFTEVTPDLFQQLGHRGLELDPSKKILIPQGITIGPEKFVRLEDHCEILRGLWDLPLIGAERLDVEHAYQVSSGGVEVTDVYLDGAFVGDVNGELWQLLERNERGFSDSEVSSAGGEKYFPACGLPKDSSLVVRTTALRELERTVSGANSEKSGSQYEVAQQSSVYRMLKAMVVLNYGEDVLDDLKQARSKRLAEIGKELEAKGYFFDSKTLRKHLKNLPD
ncbi:MAG: hypothetical protein KDJ27_07555 [Gammaproteobacteria bacterium]|nr:hypothetical protein [Gammaproteobacteria bacterium]